MLTALISFKKIAFILAITSIFFVSAKSEAAQIIPYSADLSLVKISKDQTTMMKFPEYIRKVIVPEYIPLEIRMEEKEAYLKFESPYNKTINVFFVGDKETYTLTLLPANIIDSVIFIQGPENKEERAIGWEKGNEYEEIVSKLIKIIYNGEIPPGYKAEIGGNDESPYNEVKMVRELKLYGALYSVSQFELENISQEESRFNEEEFYHDGVVAVSIVKHKLDPGEKTKIYIIKRRDAVIKN